MFRTAGSRDPGANEADWNKSWAGRPGKSIVAALRSGGITNNTYMSATLSRSFFVISISSLPAFQEGSCERSSALMARQPFAWPRFRGQPPEPAGSRRKARGVDGESARRATMVSGHYAANVTAFLLILFSPL